MIFIRKTGVQKPACDYRFAQKKPGRAAEARPGIIRQSVGGRGNDI